MNTNASTWTKPFYGVQHFGRAAGKTDSSHWVTVNDLGGSALLLRWFPGCGFAPLESTHGSADEARAAGEKWLSEIKA